MEFIILIVACLLGMWLIDHLINLLVELLLKASQVIRALIVLLMVLFLVSPDSFELVIRISKRFFSFLVDGLYEILSLLQ